MHGQQQVVLVPLNGTVVLPKTTVQVPLSHPHAAKLATQLLSSLRKDVSIGVACTSPVGGSSFATVDGTDLCATGCLVRVTKVLRTVNVSTGTSNVVVTLTGLSRMRILGLSSSGEGIVARVQPLPDRADDLEDRHMVALKLLQAVAFDFLEDIVATARQPSRAAAAKEFIAAVPTLPLATLTYALAKLGRLPPATKQALLEEDDVGRRASIVQEAMELKVLPLPQLPDADSDDTFRKFILEASSRPTTSDADSDVDDFGSDDALVSKIKGMDFPANCKKHILNEARRFGNMHESAPEHSMLRTYLETIADLPWNVSTQDNSDIVAAEAQLNADHAGLTKVKKRVLGFLAVHQLAQEASAPSSGAMLCLVGPPGVGKTSLGQSIAKALNRKFVRIALGGCNDESDIRGHRRTYIGSFPGRIISALRSAGSKNPVILLDEVDKLGVSLHGDPSAALLEVLDPAQNSTFTDSYLGIPFDLSQCLFIATANTKDTIHPALLDRMEVAQLEGYTLDEKVHIASQYLVARQTAANALPPESVLFSEAILETIVSKYTAEAGVRTLEKRIGQCCRHLAVERLREGKTAPPVFRVTEDLLLEALGRPLHAAVGRLTDPPPGVCTGLAWTPVGGTLLFVEGSHMPGSGKLIFTGMLGDVMQESVRIGLGWVRANHAALGLPAVVLKDRDLHLHFPAGGVPKDGPSAGVAIVCALYSLFSNRPVPAHVAMTGEITLVGRVSPVGGIASKLLAAHRAGITSVVLPRANEAHLADLPPTVRDDLTIILVDTALQAIEAVFDVHVGVADGGVEALDDGDELLFAEAWKERSSL